METCLVERAIIPSNRILVRNLNDGKLAAIKFAIPSIKLDTFNIDIPVTDFTINLNGKANTTIIQCFDALGNYVDSQTEIQNDYIQINFEGPFSGIINLLYEPNQSPDISYIVPSITSGEEYNAKIYAISGLSPYTYKIISGELPSGISLDEKTGTIGGIANFAETQQINIYLRVTDFYGAESYISIPIYLNGSETYGRITKAGNIRITKAGNIRITKGQ